jgi:hypothetical protein
MKNTYALALLGLPFLLAFGYLGTRSMQEDAQQEPAVPGYSFEADFFSVEEAGRLLERLGSEMRQEGRVTVGGNSYPLTGYGGIEWGVSQRGTRTGLEIEFGSSGQTTPPSQRSNYNEYQRGGRDWAPADVADLLAELGETLASTGAFVMEDHSVAFEGTAVIEQRLAERTRRGGQLQYQLETHVTFGARDTLRHSDDEDYDKQLEEGRIRDLGTSKREGADRDAVAETFASLADDLRAGRVRVADAEIPLEEEVVGFRLTHVTTTDGQTHKIEFSLRFGPQLDRGPREPRFHDQPFDQPMMDIAALLQRIATEMLDDGTYELGGQEFTVGETANYEITASPRGFTIELSYHRLRQQ